MWFRKGLIFVCMIAVGIYGMSGCVPESTGTSNRSSAATPDVLTQSNNGDNGVVESPKSAADGATLPMGQTGSGGASKTEGDAADETETEDSSAADQQELTMKQITYTSETYFFQIMHPTNFVIRPQSTEYLTQLEPAPAAALLFLHPDTAASDLGDLELADLELRIHEMGETAELEEWLIANQFLPTDGSISPQSYPMTNVAGVELCSSMLIAPGCSYFVTNGSLIYQLIPASLEGEAVMQTLKLTS